ncbi:MAG TPA: hypothetical protein QF571_00930 [Desulfobacterales bacterium]|jgi:anaerobic nitric oxide reductase flavorubredoxin|nr:hypothetical protein [Desulfobacterales bacterium]
MSLCVKNDVYWASKIDWELRKFNGDEWSTHRGSTYNPCLIKEEKVALIDTVRAPFSKEFITNLSRKSTLGKLTM